jgi:RHS repeat-associated protein
MLSRPALHGGGAPDVRGRESTAPGGPGDAASGSPARPGAGAAAPLNTKATPDSGTAAAAPSHSAAPATATSGPLASVTIQPASVPLATPAASTVTSNAGTPHTPQPYMGPIRGGLAPTVPQPGDTHSAGDLVRIPSGLVGTMPNGFSANPVRYADGIVELSFNDLPSDNTALPWGFTRSWTNAQNYALGYNGTGMVVTELPHLRQDTGGTIDLISNGYTIRYFDPNGLGGYTERYFGADFFLTDSPLTGVATLTDAQGDTITFNDFYRTVPASKQGTFASYATPAGATMAVTSYSSSNKPLELQFSTGSGSSQVIQSYLFTYLTSGVNSGMMSSALLRRQVGGGSWATVRQVLYTYYDGTQTYGNAGDLQLATREDGSGNVLGTDYYRYYTSTGSGGYVHGLKYVFEAPSYGRLTAALGTSVDSLTDSQVSPYADYNFQYDSSQRVTQEVAAGAGASGGSSPGLGTFTYAYTASTNTPGLNSWAMKTVETLPDGNENIVYTNAAGEVMLFVYEDTGSNTQWDTFYEYNSAAQVILAAQPSAVTGYNDSYADLLHYVPTSYQYLSNSSGLITLYDYGTSTTAGTGTAGSVTNYLADVQIEQGQAGTEIMLESQLYYAHTGSSATIYPLASTTAYRNTNGTGGETTSYSYAWVGANYQPSSVTVSAPVISSGENGPGTADTVTTYFDSVGRAQWVMDGDGYIRYLGYDSLTGAVTETIADVNTSGSPPSGLPSGWSTPSGGGLNLITQFTVDALGRPTEETDAAGNATYVVYDDIDHEERVYPGWNSSTSTPTGPTQVVRQDYANGYTETLTMSATPHLTSGVPDGTESIGSVQTLSRSLTNTGGQVTEVDNYFNLSGVTYSTTAQLGTSGTNYYATLYGYDSRGRNNRVQYPTGTIERTVSDGLGRTVSTWEGTDDTPGSGSWSPTNNTSPSNMVQLTAEVYDGGGVGDGNLTQETEYPGGSAANRVTNYFYDWRDRLVAEKDGVQTTEDSTTHRPIYYYTMDNLDEVTQVQRYDGDGVTITTSSGVPQAPSSSLLRAQTNYSYDDQQRVYEVQEYSVDPSTGSVSTYALTTNYYYNHRGLVIEESDPGGLVTKDKYDGAERLTVQYTTDGAGGTSWSAAGSVSSDNVLQQVEYTLDADGNAILTTTRQRFHNETATGALGNPTTTPKARVSYLADYYDAANRQTAEVDVGTNGGSSYTRPSSVPTGSATVLVTSTSYNAAGWVSSTTDPRGIVTNYYYDNLGRTTETIEDYTDGTPTASSNKTIEYTYDGDNHVLTVKLDLPSTAYETTQFVYGVTTSGGSAVNSNDILAATEYPDPSTGSPSTSSEETYTVNALGQTVSYTDRDGNVHSYTYDVLGRETADAVTTLGSGVDGAVRRIETAYDTQGNAYLFTTYNAASCGSIVNQVEDVFNGLGQLTGSYQSHSGAVNTSTTPEVQYGYSLMSGGANNSRLTSITYPNGYVLSYNYNTGVDNTISRLSYLSDSSGTLQSYSYLGLATPVIIADPQPGIELTYVQQTGDAYANTDGGDQYTGLDRFGRIIDQFWLNTNTSTATDRLQYGYDSDGNVLYKNNLVNSSFSELYHANGSSNGYDNLNQLTNFARGTLNSTNDTISSPSTTNSWSMDAAGNFTSINGTTETNNKQNAATGFGSATLTYDGNGNLTTDQNGNTLVYNAWNELVAYKNGGTTLETMTYDGLGRRIAVNSGTATDLYYSKDWQVLEEQVGGQAKAHYVWSPVYVDALVLRDRDTGGGTLSERLWVQQDADWNVTALVNGSGSVVERYVYDPYGTSSVLSASWATLSSSAYAWIYGHQGGRLDTTTELYYFRNRDLSPALDRWGQVDPSGFGGGDVNLYRDESNSTPLATDPLGLMTIIPWFPGDPYPWEPRPKAPDYVPGWFDTLGNIPIINTPWAIAEIIDGWHMRGPKFGEPLTPPEKVSNGIEVAMNGMALAGIIEGGTRPTVGRGGSPKPTRNSPVGRGGPGASEQPKPHPPKYPAAEQPEFDPTFDPPSRRPGTGHTPKGRPYSPHYELDPTKGPARNIPGSVVDSVIDNYPGVRQPDGTVVHYDPDNNITVVTGRDGIVSAHKGEPRPGQRP